MVGRQIVMFGINDLEMAKTEEISDGDIYKEFYLYDELLAGLAESFDMNGIVEIMNKNFKALCQSINVKRLHCDIIMSENALIQSMPSMDFVIYESAGPEFDNVMRQLKTPSGETIQCSVSFLNYNPSEIQVLKGKLLCQIVCLYVSRARVGANLLDSYNKDSATGIPNMNAFLQYGNKIFEDYSIADYCVIALNVSNFKYVNQTVPFNVGTTVLMRYAHKLMTFMEPGEMVTRGGGDNFNIILKKKNLDSFIENVKLVPIDVNNGSTRVHFELVCYAGVCRIDTRMSIHAALECASMAKAVAKKTPHNSVVFYDDEIGERQHHANEVRAQFQQALENHEFVAYYQPKVNIHTQEIVGMEALVRWESDGRVYGPGTFVPILENSRYIIDLDNYMLRQVCRDIKRWQSMGIEVPRISVNLSRRNLENDNTADDIAATLDEYSVDYKYVEIEVTETMDNAGLKSLTEFISKMKIHGIKVSIDDFGTGYSSLQAMKTMNADVLKIDRSFINLEEFTERDELMVRSIVELAKAYNMEVITEGVETEEQMKFMVKVGCNNIQGYFFDKPLCKEKVTDIIKIGKYNKKYSLA
jgi:diguanylate cyclase (GGDEF)-like protein